MEIIFFVLIWWIVGLWGFIYWWTTEFTLEIQDLIFGCFCGTIGPLTWIMGWIIHSKEKWRKIRICNKKEKML